MPKANVIHLTQSFFENVMAFLLSNVLRSGSLMNNKSLLAKLNMKLDATRLAIALLRFTTTVLLQKCQMAKSTLQSGGQSRTAVKVLVASHRS